MKTAIAAVLFIATGLVAAEKPQAPNKDNWERMKACRAQAEKVGGEHLLESHYSPKYGRCFMVTFAIEGDSLTILRDAFEGTVLATERLHSDEDIRKTHVTWTIGSPHASPHEVSRDDFHAWVDEHMNN